MDLNKLIIITHARAHAAELAVTARQPDCACDELIKLRELLNDQPELEACGAREPPEQEEV